MTVRLTKTQSKVLKMRYQGLKNKEIAKNLRVSEANISQIISNAVKKLETIQDTLSLMKDLGLMENDAAIELTKTGTKFSDEFKKSRKLRITSRTNKFERSYNGLHEAIKTGDIYDNFMKQEKITKELSQKLEELNKNLIVITNKIGVNDVERPYRQKEQVLSKKDTEHDLKYIR